VGRLFREAKSWQVELDAPALGYALGKSLERLAGRLREQPDDAELLLRLDSLVGLALPLPVNLWPIQNLFYGVLKSDYTAWRQRSEEGSAAAALWVERFRALGGKLGVRVE